MDGCMVVLGGRRVKGGEAWRWRHKLADMLERGDCVGSPPCLGKDMIPFYFLPPLLCSAAMVLVARTVVGF
jgi:hypothetical protein